MCGTPLLYSAHIKHRAIAGPSVQPLKLIARIARLSMKCSDLQTNGKIVSPDLMRIASASARSSRRAWRSTACAGAFVTDAERLHAAIQVRAVDAQGFGRAGDVAV